MSAIIMGNIIGRALFSYLIVWIAFYLFSKFKYKCAFRATLTVKGCTAIGLIFALPILSQMGASL